MKEGNAMLQALAKKGGDYEPEAEESEDVDTGSEAKTQASRDLIAAIKKGDVDAVSQAMTDHYNACAAGAGESESEEAEEA
jgi:DNA-binding GntR family transcriptional regulator